MAAPMKIGEVARRSGLTVKTIRFYCDEELIHPISRSEGGYRLFGDEVFAELALIRTKAGEIVHKIAALRDLQSELEDLLSRWQDCGGRKGSAA